jgi:hypothetical protein
MLADDAAGADALAELMSDSVAAADQSGGDAFALASMFGDWGDAIQECIHSAEQLPAGGPPMERDCCCNGCVHDFFTHHTAAAKETHGKLSRLKSEVEKRDRTRCVQCSVRS